MQTGQIRSDVAGAVELAYRNAEAHTHTYLHLRFIRHSTADVAPVAAT